MYTSLRKFYAWVGFITLLTLAAIALVGLYRVLVAQSVMAYEAPPEVTVLAVVTAYSSSIDETDSDPFITASNQQVREGIVANNCLPFGTFVWIGAKLYEVTDRMNSRYDCNHYDVWMPSKKLALEWGRQVHEVRVIK